MNFQEISIKVEDNNHSESMIFFNNLANKHLEVRCIRNFYKTNGSFDKDRDMNVIAWYVIEHFLNEDPTAVIHSGLMLKLQRYMIEEFPTTDECVWFVKSGGGKNPRGKLYDAYNDWKLRLRNANLRDAERDHSGKKQCTESNNVLTSDISKLAVERLKDDVNLDYVDQVKQDWHLTYTQRREEINNCGNPQDVFDKYPVYKSVIGRDMIIFDAEKTLNCNHHFSRIKSIYGFLLNLLVNKKNKTDKEKHLSTIAQTVTDDETTQVLICLLTLSSHITPTVISLNKKTYKPTKNEVQEGFYHILQDDSLQSEHEQKLANTGIFIYSIGEITDLQNLQTIVNVFSHRFLFKDLMGAFDFAFKCFYGLNAKYPRMSGALWYIIQKLVYDFEHPDDKDVRTTSADTLISKVKFNFPHIYQ